MKPLAIVYVRDMERSKAFYRALAPEVAVRNSSPMWTELDFGGVSLALHGTGEDAEFLQSSRLELSFVAEGPLEALLDRLTAQGIQPHRGIADEAFGRSLVLTDPDGLLIQVNEHDTDLYATG